MNTPGRGERTNHEEASGAPHRHPPAELVTAADLLAGAAMPMRFTLNVTLRPGSREEAKLPRAPGIRRRGPVLDERIGRHTAGIFDWAGRSTENAELMLTDPVSAVERSGTKLSAAEGRALRRHVEALSAAETLPAGAELVGLKVKIADDPYKKTKKAEAQQSRSRGAATKREGQGEQ